MTMWMYKICQKIRTVFTAENNEAGLNGSHFMAFASVATLLFENT